MRDKRFGGRSAAWRWLCASSRAGSLRIRPLCRTAAHPAAARCPPDLLPPLRGKQARARGPRLKAGRRRISPPRPRPPSRCVRAGRSPAAPKDRSRPSAPRVSPAARRKRAHHCLGRSIVAALGACAFRCGRWRLGAASGLCGRGFRRFGFLDLFLDCSTYRFHRSGNVHILGSFAFAQQHRDGRIHLHAFGAFGHQNFADACLRRPLRIPSSPCRFRFRPECRRT